MDTAQKLAEEFARVMKEYLTPAEWLEMKRRNANDPNTASTCASHDFCDANMAMAEAFQKVTGREPDVQSNEDSALWSTAWYLARSQGMV